MSWLITAMIFYDPFRIFNDAYEFYFFKMGMKAWKFQCADYVNEYSNEGLMFSVGDAAGADGSGGWETVLGTNDPASSHSAASGGF